MSVCSCCCDECHLATFLSHSFLQDFLQASLISVRESHMLLLCLWFSAFNKAACAPSVSTVSLPLHANYSPFLHPLIDHLFYDPIQLCHFLFNLMQLSPSLQLPLLPLTKSALLHYLCNRSCLLELCLQQCDHLVHYDDLFHISHPLVSMELC
jgi:hypothetical protein